MKNLLTVEEISRHLEYRDGHLLWVLPTNKSIRAGQRAGSIDRKGYLRVTLNGKRVFTHHIVWLLKTGKQLRKSDEIDHVNNDPLDNRFENLRLASRSENQRNKKISANNSSSVKGVSWDKNRNKWQAHVNVDGKKIGVGRYDNLKDAEKAVKLFRSKTHGCKSHHG